MATRHNRRIKRKSCRGGMLTGLRNTARTHGLYDYASTTDAAREIKNLFAKGYPLDEESDKIFSEILGRKFSAHGKIKLIEKLFKYSHEHDPPKHIMAAIAETQRRIVDK